MLIIDKNTRPAAPTSLFLTRAEFKELYPHLLTDRKSYIFKYDKPLNVPDGEAKLLMRKYPRVLKWEEDLGIVKSNRHQELMKLTYGEVKRVGGKLGFSFKDLQGKKLLLIERIVSEEITVAARAKKARATKGN